MQGLDELVGRKWVPDMEFTVRAITGRSYVQVVEVGSMMSAEFRSDRVRVAVDQSDRIVEFLIG